MVVLDLPFQRIQEPLIHKLIPIIVLATVRFKNFSDS